MNKNRNKNNKNQILFGAKCILLAFAIIISALLFICDYVYPDYIPKIINAILRIISLIIVAVVMIFEIVPYIQLSNAGIRNIYREKDIQIEKFGKFNKTISHNDLVYKFQPIVNAKDGSIFAYESLMRTKPEIGLAPRDILKYAEISQKLYDIEYYTFFNTLRIYSENPDLFADKKVFINSIPSITLTDEHLKKLKEKFGSLTENAVVEILEDSEDTEESLAAFKKIQELFGCQIAIDDYGSGYSNESKLIHNNPNYIKIDIDLISSIESDRKKQFLVSNIINFARRYGIKVLGEGVETKEELQTLIELGVDLVQGFYLAKPNTEIIKEIPHDIKSFIIGENIRLAKYNSDLNVYEASENEVIKLLDIALDKYTVINVKSGSVTLIGEPTHTIEMVIKTAPNSECTINLDSVNIKGTNETTIQIGENGKLRLNLIGDSTLCKEGIRVPASSELIIRGDGNLAVNADRNDGVSIGGNYTDTYGSISIDCNGVIDIKCSGDRIIGIGGGTQDNTAITHLIDGKINILGYGITAVGIGSICGYTTILSAECEIDILMNADEGVGIGSISGYIKYESSCDTQVKVRGETIIGIGVIKNGNGSITFTHGIVNSDVRGANAVCIGSFDSNIDISTEAELLFAYGEGTKVCGIGNRDGEGKVTIKGGCVKSYILSADPNWFGNNGKNVIITGGCIIEGENGIIEPTNNNGESLEKMLIEDEPEFVKQITTEKSNYTYRAERPIGETSFYVFLPVNCELKTI